MFEESMLVEVLFSVLGAFYFLMGLYVWKIDPVLYKKEWYWRFRERRIKFLKKMGLYKNRVKSLYYE